MFFFWVIGIRRFILKIIRENVRKEMFIVGIMLSVIYLIRIKVCGNRRVIEIIEYMEWILNRKKS